MTDTKDLKRRVRDKLRTLGSTPKEIAESLERFGIEGDIGSSFSCPITNYVLREFSDEIYRACTYVSVSLLGVNNEELGDVPLSCVQNEFVEKFDKGTYPALVSNPDVLLEEDI